ncbi:MAG: alanine racemase [Acidobacteria bacterium]|jgi:alanine racemase|nr:alanine racemase [Acidobacteriota bacterium]
MAELQPRHRPTVLEIDLDAIRRNAERLKRHARGAALLAVVKADAYGHGAVQVASLLERSSLAEWFGVALLEEAAVLREAGIQKPILMLGPLHQTQAKAALERGLTPAIYNLEILKAIAEASAGQPCAIHLKIDSGMGRLGFRPDELPAALETLASFPWLTVEGFFSNLASADDPDSPQTASQIATFKEMLSLVRARGHDPKWVDLANSAGLLAHPESRFKMVRPGLALYGLRPSSKLPDIGLEQAAAFRTVVIQVKDLPKGTPVGYSATYVTPKPQRIGILPIGYADGLPRCAGNERGYVLVRGKRCALLGRVSMDLCAIDLEPAGHVTEGEPVTLWGKEGEESLTPQDWANWAGTIPYEITTHLNPRVARRYRLDGKWKQS